MGIYFFYYLCYNVIIAVVCPVQPQNSEHAFLRRGTAMKKGNNTEKSFTECRLNKVGGQAVLEGVMMKAGCRVVTTCRKEDGSLAVTDDSFVSVRKKHKILNLPIVRGIINFVEMMMLSVKTLGASADAMELDEVENPSRFERWLSEKLKIRLTDVVMVVSVILGLALSVGLFLLLPIWITAGINALLTLFGVSEMGAFLTSVVEGVLKMGIFVGYLLLVSLMPDIKRTFMYHGAEHKSIACFEAGEELTPENAAKHKRLHPRCGTSFMFFMILIGIFVGIIIKSLIPGLDTWIYTALRLLILPLVVGVGYEIIMLAGRHDNIITRILSAPGLWMQKITTKEPTKDMLEVAIVSIKCALRDDFPEFMDFYNNREWEEKPNEDSVIADEEINVKKAATDTESTGGEINVKKAATDTKNADNTAPVSNFDLAEPKEEEK